MIMAWSVMSMSWSLWSEIIMTWSLSILWWSWHDHLDLSWAWHDHFDLGWSWHDYLDLWWSWHDHLVRSVVSLTWSLWSEMIMAWSLWSVMIQDTIICRSSWFNGKRLALPKNKAWGNTFLVRMSMHSWFECDGSSPAMQTPVGSRCERWCTWERSGGGE